MNSVAPVTPTCSQSATQKKFDFKNLNNPTLCIPELNKRYAVVKFGSKTLVADEHDKTIDFLSFTDFQNLYNNIEVYLGNNVCKKLGQYWLNHPNRRQYLDGVVFDPAMNSGSGHFNLYRGLAISPEPNHCCQRFLSHLETVICSGNRELNEYLLNWLALLVQKPGELPEVAIVMLSNQGTGKSLFVEYIGKIFGRHYKHLIHVFP